MRTIAVALLAVSAISLAGVVAVVTRDGASDREAEPAINEVTITAYDLGFDPAEIVLDAGQRARLSFINGGRIDHDLSIAGISSSNVVVVPADSMHDSLDHASSETAMHGHDHADDMRTPGTVHLSASPGERAIAEFTPKAGTYDVVCTIPGHREAGMVGRVIAR